MPGELLTHRFAYCREPQQNPYCGFVSFQHFRGEKLFADVTVVPGNNNLETEPVECYPPADDAAEIPAGDGFYPDSSVAYIRFLWKDFEPEQGRYDYGFVDRFLREAEAHGQEVMLRLMPHSTRRRDDVPDWLRALIPCPDRPDGMRLKDSPTDPLFLELFGKAVEALGRRFDGDPALFSVDISLPGAWGEGHRLEDYPESDIRRLVDRYLASFPTVQLNTQLSAGWLIDYMAKQGRAAGIRGDGLGDPAHLTKYYPSFYEAIPEDQWKRAPVSFESYWWCGEWKRHGWDLDGIIDYTLAHHISSFNGKSMAIPEEWREKMLGWMDRMGYHFYLERASFPAEAAAGGTITLILGGENRGVAPLYRDLPLTVQLLGPAEAVIPTEIQPCRWLPGPFEETAVLSVPAGLPVGEYRLAVRIGGEKEPCVAFCSRVEMADGWAVLGGVSLR